jgi:3-phenylpropionate/trans-cinnamate dioxygenase ferredoxin reductase component
VLGPNREPLRSNAAIGLPFDVESGLPVNSRVIIVGTAQAGVQAVDTLRREGHLGRVVLIGDELHHPYQRPPLSKKYLAGELTIDRLFFRQQAFYDQHRVELRLGTCAVRLDLPGHTLLLSGGEVLQYDRLLLCLGSRPRELTCPGASADCVRYLRGIDDVAAIHQRLEPGSRVTVIGGGFIGPEVAATAAQLGCRVTVLESADRVMNRAVAPAISQFLETQHRLNGVNIVCNSRVLRLEGDSNVVRVLCEDGTALEADLLVAGVGAAPNVELARDAGIRCENGILVDEYCRTSESDIYAAGDCTSHPSIRYCARVRLESVDNAVE